MSSTTPPPTSMFKNWSNNGFFKSATVNVLNWNIDSSLPSSLFFISCQIHICYTTKPSPSSPPMEMTQHVESPYNLSSPCSHFSSDDHQPQSLQNLSSFISNMNIPFSRNRLHWISCNNSEPVPVRSQGDLVSCVFQDICSIASEVSVVEYEQDSKLALHICLVLKRTVVLTKEDFDTLLQALDNRDREEGEGELPTLASDLMEYRMRDDFSIPALQEFFFSNKGIALTKDLIYELSETVLKERLLKKVLTLDQDSDKLCSICHEELRDDGEAKVATPCSHLFHQDCIMKWIKERNACPMCRFRF